MLFSFNQKLISENGIKGFTLIEILVVSFIIGIIGIILSDVITRNLSGSQKILLIGQIKQTGQTALDQMSQIIRNSDLVVCTDLSWSVSGGVGDIIALFTHDGRYVRFRYLHGSVTGGNGYLAEDFPNTSNLFFSGDPYASVGDTSYPSSSRRLCNSDPITGIPLNQSIFLSSTDPQNGTDVLRAQDPYGNDIKPFSVIRSPGAADTVTIQFRAKQGSAASSTYASQVNPIQFRQTIQLRSD